MNHCELEEVTQHINNKISMIKRLLELRAVGKLPAFAVPVTSDALKSILFYKKQNYFSFN